MKTSLDFAPNRLYYGDCLEVMRGWPAKCADLVYLDPPFNSKTNYNVLYGEGNGVSAQVRAFADTWHWDEAAAARMAAVERAPARRSHRALCGLRTVLGETGMLAYLTYMGERLEECRRVMRDHASVYLHCDPTASHYLKIVCDGVFEAKNFRSEITWKRTSAHSDTKQGRKQHGRIHDIILFYTKSRSWTWNPIYTPYDDSYVQSFYKHVEPRTERRYRLGDLTGPGGAAKGNPRYELMGVTRYWRYSKERMAQLMAERRIVQTRPGAVPAYKRYLDEMPGVPLQDIWTDIQPVAATSAEQLGYPTQKPVALMKRIIEGSSNKGDIVLDPFCGCGTTIAAAELTNRRWVGVDISPFAVKLVRERRLRPMGRDAEIAGIPTDMEGAQMLLARSPLDFEAWAVTSIPGLAPNERRTGDRGIDGRGAMMHPPEGETSRLVVAQVKGGGYTASTLRDFQHVIAREKAAVGVYITLRKVNAKNARQAAAGMGTLKVGAQTYPKLQLWSVQELLEGKRPSLPDMADPYTGKRVRQAELFE